MRLLKAFRYFNKLFILTYTVNEMRPDFKFKFFEDKRKPSETTKNIVQFFDITKI